MGMTIWIHTLEDGKLSKESDDHSLMLRHGEELDQVCEELGVAKLSSFYDSTDLEFNMADEFDEEGETEAVEQELDPVTGWPYPLESMNWFDAAAGKTVLLALRDRLATSPPADLVKDAKELIEELDDCIGKLENPAHNGGEFHLALLM
jgi:hypothetical protein